MPNYFEVAKLVTEGAEELPAFTAALAKGDAGKAATNIAEELFGARRASEVSTKGSVSALVNDVTARPPQSISEIPDNPYLDEFNRVQSDPRYQTALAIARGRSSSTAFSYRDAFHLANDTRTALTHKYSWAVPNSDALALTVEQGPLIEAGAGSGYWSHLLKKMGADVVAFDKHGSDVASNYYHRTAAKSWTDVISGTEEAVGLHPGRTLFMSFPPHGEPFGSNVLKNYGGKRFVFVGELGDGSCTGDAEFHKTLDTDWRPLKSVEIPNWEVASGRLWDQLHLFERR